MRENEKSSGSMGEYLNKPLEIEPSSQFKFAEEKSKGIIVNTALTKIKASQGGSFGPGNKIVLEIPSTAWTDFSKLFISFQFRIKKGDGNFYGGWQPGTLPGSWNFIRLKNSAHSIFERMTILFGSSQPMEDIVEYDLVSKILAMCTLTDHYVEKHGFLFEGIHNERDYHKQCMANFNANSLETRTDAASAGNGHQYLIQPCLSIFRCGKFIPTAYTGMITLWLYCAQPERVLIRSVRAQGHVNYSANVTPIANDAGAHFLYGLNYSDLANESALIDENNVNNVFEPNATYQLDDVKMFVTTLYPMAEYNTAMNSKLSSGTPVKIWMDFFRVHSRQITNVWNNSLDVLINERAADLKAVLAVMVNQGDRASKVQELAFHHNYLSKYRLRIGDQYFPSQDVECASQGGIEAYQQLMETIGIDKDIYGTNLIDTDWGYRPRNNFELSNIELLDKYRTYKGCTHSHQFILGHNFETSPGQLSGEDTLRQNSDILFQLNFSPNGNFEGGNPQGTRRRIAATPEDNEGVCILPIFTSRPHLGTLGAAATALTSTNLGLNSSYRINMAKVNRDAAGNLSITAETAWASQVYPVATLGSSVDDALGYSMTKMFNSFGWIMQMMSQPLEQTGFCSPVPFIADTTVGGAGLANYAKISGSVNTPNVICLSRAAQTNATERFVARLALLDLTVRRLRPTSFEFFCICHVTGKLIIETFGTATVTTDIYNS